MRRGRELVAAGRPVVDLDPLVVRATASRTASRNVGSPTSTTRSGQVERALELGERGRERTLGIGARHREQRPPRGEQREALGRREPQRPAEVVGEADRHAAVVVSSTSR